MFLGMYFFIKFIVVFIVVFMIGNLMMMNIVESMCEMVILSVIGFEVFYVMLLFWLEGVFIGVFGVMGSVLVGYCLVVMINVYGIVMLLFLG